MSTEQESKSQKLIEYVDKFLENTGGFELTASKIDCVPNEILTISKEFWDTMSPELLREIDVKAPTYTSMSGQVLSKTMDFGKCIEDAIAKNQEVVTPVSQTKPKSSRISNKNRL